VATGLELPATFKEYKKINFSRYQNCGLLFRRLVRQTYAKQEGYSKTSHMLIHLPCKRIFGEETDFSVVVAQTDFRYL